MHVPVFALEHTLKSQPPNRQLRKKDYRYPASAFHVGYYTAKDAPARCHLADPGSEVHRAIRYTAGAMSALETAVAPAVAARRLGVQSLAHPGILPGVPREEVAAFAMGVSQVGLIRHE